MQKDSKKIVKIAKALADENRFKIFITISEKGEIACKEITSLFNLTQPTISHHLKVLMESGLIDFRKEGQWSYFFVNKEVLDKYVSSLAEHVTQ
ncbi:MAG: helix-turn-helix transcriptional regulator [Ignavibacteriales bacterium]|nr:helix-turn-helix transcriptional regulator [Ignavibacteriales bacterium]